MATVCCKHGPGYASPVDAIRGPRERYILVSCTNYAGNPDMIASVDVNPSSPAYCKVGLYIPARIALTTNDRFEIY